MRCFHASAKKAKAIRKGDFVISSSSTFLLDLLLLGSAGSAVVIGSVGVSPVETPLSEASSIVSLTSRECLSHSSAGLLVRTVEGATPLLLKRRCNHRVKFETSKKFSPEDRKSRQGYFYIISSKDHRRGQLCFYLGLRASFSFASSLYDMSLAMSVRI